MALGVDYDRDLIMLNFWIFSPLFLYTRHGVQKSGIAWESRRFCLGMAASVAKVSYLFSQEFPLPQTYYHICRRDWGGFLALVSLLSLSCSCILLGFSSRKKA